MGEYVKVNKYPDCDFCKEEGTKTPAKYDGATTRGPWAYMCEDHFMQYGRGLGTGRGQKLIAKANRVEDIVDLPAEEMELAVEPFYFSTLDSLWQTAQEEYGAGVMNKNILYAFEEFADASEGMTRDQVREWSKKRFPKLFI